MKTYIHTCNHCAYTTAYISSMKLHQTVSHTGQEPIKAIENV